MRRQTDLQAQVSIRLNHGRRAKGGRHHLCQLVDRPAFLGAASPFSDDPLRPRRPAAVEWSQRKRGGAMATILEIELETVEAIGESLAGLMKAFTDRGSPR